MGRNRFANVGKMIPSRKRGNEGKGEMEAGRNGETEEITNGSEFSDGSKIQAKTGAGANKPKKRRKKLSKTGETERSPTCFLPAGAGAPCGAKKKRHAGGHDARRAIGHSV